MTQEQRALVTLQQAFGSRHIPAEMSLVDAVDYVVSHMQELADASKFVAGNFH